MNVNFIKNNFILKNVGYHFSCNINAIFNYILKKVVSVDFSFAKKQESRKIMEASLDFFRLYKFGFYYLYKAEFFPHLNWYVHGLKVSKSWKHFFRTINSSKKNKRLKKLSYELSGLFFLVFRSFFGRIDNSKNCFLDLLTFKPWC